MSRFVQNDGAGVRAVCVDVLDIDRDPRRWPRRPRRGSRARTRGRPGGSRSRLTGVDLGVDDTCPVSSLMISPLPAPAGQV